MMFMSYIEKLQYWGDQHHPRYVDIIRIGLGVFLLVKGIDFASNTAIITGMLTGQVPFGSFMLLILVHYVIFVHVVGGFMIAIGLLTRTACIAQIPVLLGAIFFVNWNVMNYFSGLVVAILVLLLLVYFTIIGSGPWSLDRAIDEKRVR